MRTKKSLILPLVFLIFIFSVVSVAFAVDTSTGLSSRGEGISQDSAGYSSSGSSSVHLYAPLITDFTDSKNWHEARIRIEPVDLLLEDLQNISWMTNVLKGYTPHVDVFLSNDKVLVFEYAKSSDVGCDTALGSYPIGTFSTFGAIKGEIIDDTTYAWESIPGPCGEGIFDAQHKSLNEWKTTYSGAKVIALEIEVDGWIAESEAYVDDVRINGKIVEYFDEVAPTLSNTFIEPMFPTTSDLITIKASFNDESGVDKVEIKWRFFTVEDDFERYSTPGYVEMIKSGGIFSSPTPIPSPTTEGGFGEGYVEYRLRPYDENGNYEDTGVIENPFYFTYDDTPPVTTNILDKQFITSNTEIVLTAVDPDLDGDTGKYKPSGVKFTTYQINNNPVADYTAPFNITGADGLYTIKFFSVDNTGNQESEKTVTVTLDNLNPNLTINNPQDGSIYDTLSLLVDITATDNNLNKVLYSINGGENSTYENSLTENFAEGRNTFEVWAIDKSGNVNYKSITFIVDTIEPTIADDYSNNDRVWVNSPQTIILTPVDSGSGINEVKWCEGVGCNPVDILTSPYELIFNVSQDKVVRYQSFDFAGNPSVIEEFNVKIDLENPVTTESGAVVSWINQDVAITLTCEDGSGDVSGCDKIFYSTDGSEPTILYGGQFTLSGTGEYQLKYSSRDNAGNIENVVMGTLVKIDLENPLVIITSESLTDRMDYFVVKANVSDVGGSELRNITLTLKNATHTFVDNVQMTLVLDEDYEYLLRMWELVAGIYTLEVTAMDNAGNINIMTQIFEVRENVAPSKITSTNNQVDIATGGIVSFNFDVVVRNGGEIVFGIDDIAGLSPHSLNATISDGTTSVPVGKGIGFIGSGILTLEDLDLDNLNVQGTFTLYLDFPKDMIPGNYPINYFINVVY